MFLPSQNFSAKFRITQKTKALVLVKFQICIMDFSQHSLFILRVEAVPN